MPQILKQDTCPLSWIQRRCPLTSSVTACPTTAVNGSSPGTGCAWVSGLGLRAGGKDGSKCFPVAAELLDNPGRAYHSARVLPPSDLGSQSSDQPEWRVKGGVWKDSAKIAATSFPWEREAKCLTGKKEPPGTVPAKSVISFL